MKKFWLVASYEYLRHVRRKRFLFSFLSMPILLVVMVIIVFAAATSERDARPIGFVDAANWLPQPVLMPAVNENSFEKPLELIQFPDQNSAQDALKAKQIQAFFVIEADYPTSGKIQMVSLENTGDEIRRVFREFLRLNLLREQPQSVVTRLMEGSHFTIQSYDRERQLSPDQWWSILLPIMAGIFFVIAINISSGYLLQAIVEEKENRTMEMIITSISPNQLMAGKIVGNLSVGLTIILIWLCMGLGGLLVVRTAFFPEMQIGIPIGNLLLIIFILLPAFIIVAAWMAIVGSTMTEEREAQQVAGLISIILVAPYWFGYQLLSRPNGTLAVILSLFPLTAPVALPIRAAFTNIPTWQMVLVFILMFGSAGFSLWLAGKAFHLGMLRYGKRLSLKELFQKSQIL